MYLKDLFTQSIPTTFAVVLPVKIECLTKKII